MSFNLGRAGLRWRRYISALDFNPCTGRLHRHVVTAGGPFLHPSVLREHARRAGLGHINVRAIEDSPQDRRNIANYVASNGVHFAAAFAAAHLQSARRIQPFSRSHRRA